MWTVIYITQDRETAFMIKKLLSDAGLLVKLRSLGSSADGRFGCYEIMLPQSEVEEGHAFIINHVF